MNTELSIDTGGLDRTVVARTFAAYLMGSRSFDKSSIEGKNGPFQKNEGDDSRWQLDNSNDFWLHFEPDGRAWLNHRYAPDREICMAMVQLFKLKYARWGET